MARPHVAEPGTFESRTRARSQDADRCKCRPCHISPLSPLSRSVDYTMLMEMLLDEDSPLRKLPLGICAAQLSFLDGIRLTRDVPLRLPSFNRPSASRRVPKRTGSKSEIRYGCHFPGCVVHGGFVEPISRTHRANARGKEKITAHPPLHGGNIGRGSVAKYRSTSTPRDPYYDEGRYASSWVPSLALYCGTSTVAYSFLLDDCWKSSNGRSSDFESCRKRIFSARRSRNAEM